VHPMFGTTRRGVQISYKLAGARTPPLTLLPGWMIAHSGSWAHLAQRLAGSARIIRYDSRGTGGSDRPVDPAAYELELLVEDAVAVLDVTGTDRTVLVGNSLGGLLALLLAARYPDRVSGLVLIGANVDLVGGPAAPLQQAIATFTDPPAVADGWSRYNLHSWRRDYPGFVDWFVATALGPEASADDLAEGRVEGLDVGPDVLAATVMGRPGGAGLTARLRRLVAATAALPALVITGDRDDVCPPQWSIILAETMGTTHVVLPGAGHCPHVTRPDEVADLITSFLKET
jgi:pimeloyl-ACP methyl ester carboxylesterase